MQDQEAEKKSPSQLSNQKITNDNALISERSNPKEINSTETKPTESDKLPSPVPPPNFPKSMDKAFQQKIITAKTPEEAEKYVETYRKYMEIRQNYLITRYKTTLSISCFLAGVALQVLNLSSGILVSGVTIGQFLVGVGLAGLGIDFYKGSKAQ